MHAFHDTVGFEHEIFVATRNLHHCTIVTGPVKILRLSPPENEVGFDRAAGLRPEHRHSLRKKFRKREDGESERIEKRMHCHRDKNGAAPLVGDRETAPQNEQRYE